MNQSKFFKPVDPPYPGGVTKILIDVVEVIARKNLGDADDIYPADMRYWNWAVEIEKSTDQSPESIEKFVLEHAKLEGLTVDLCLAAIEKNNRALSSFINTFSNDENLKKEIKCALLEKANNGNQSTSPKP